jgi:hypothetical protein
MENDKQLPATTQDYNIKERNSPESGHSHFRHPQTHTSPRPSPLPLGLEPTSPLPLCPFCHQLANPFALSKFGHPFNLFPSYCLPPTQLRYLFVFHPHPAYPFPGHAIVPDLIHRHFQLSQSTHPGSNRTMWFFFDYNPASPSTRPMDSLRAV